jgi:hypothetical protein
MWWTPLSALTVPRQRGGLLGQVRSIAVEIFNPPSSSFSQMEQMRASAGDLQRYFALLPTSAGAGISI